MPATSHAPTSLFPNARFALASHHPATTPAEIAARTGFAFDALRAGPTPAPTERERAGLASLDPHGEFAAQVGG